ncbi:DUF3179 domain-containing protein [Zobellella maritima]|uniref:DUF3179 domain-containing protein n=1 Tax=Zobellella maritima TaxID=2059725 RepID=UPI0018E4EB26|nr:DUF3179 domain-containing protein [Zobellella maritima]
MKLIHAHLHQGSKRARYMVTFAGLMLGLLLYSGGLSARDTRLNGFVLDDALVPINEILPGGPPRDGIPAIDKPVFIGATEADRILSPDDEVIGLVHLGEVKAYPVAILNWHEVVNDRLGEDPVAVTYCPLCATATVFIAELDGRTLEFGVSGLLYNSNVLLYDRQSESLWSQVMARAISGPMKGRMLNTLPLSLTSWQSWYRRHPDTRVLSADTGYFREYERDPYRRYATINKLMFPVRSQSRALPLKEMVTGLVVNGEAKAYPHRILNKSGGPLFDTLGGERLRITLDPAGNPHFFSEDGRELSGQPGYWFAWFAFYPETAIFGQ